MNTPARRDQVSPANLAINPYASPRAEFAHFEAPWTHDGNVWRDGPLLIVRRGAELPDWCVRCGSAASGRRVKRYLTWAPLLVRLASVALAVGVYFVFRPLAMLAVCSWLLGARRATVEVGLCDRHAARRFRGQLVGTASLVLGLGLVFFEVWRIRGGLPMVGALPAGLAVLALGIGYAAWADRAVRARRIDRQWLHLAGCARGFLDRLPSGESPR